MSTQIPTVIAACAGTILATAAIVTLTAAAQEYVLGRERDTAIELHALAGKVASLENGQAALNSRIAALERGQAALNSGQAGLNAKMDQLIRLSSRPAERQEYVTRAELEAAMKALVAQLIDQSKAADAAE